MDTRIQKLIDAFQLKGWQFITSADSASDWWFSDIFQLRPDHSNGQANIYLTLVTDPRLVDQKIVWCIGVSSNIPVQNPIKYLASLSLNDIKKIDLSAFVDNISKAILA